MAKLSTRNLVARAEEGSTFVVLDRTAKPNEDGEFPPLLGADGAPATITVMGDDSPMARRLGYHRRAAQQTRAMTIALSGKKKQYEETPDEIAAQDQAEIDKAVALTKGWTGFEGDDDQPLPCTAEHVRLLYEQDPDILAQAIEHIRNRARFFGHTSTPSVPTVSTSSH